MSKIEIPYIEPIAIGEKYEFSYRGIDYKGKTIIDIGADVGSTTSYFLRNGAKKVIAVEPNEIYFPLLVSNTLNVRELCEPLNLMIYKKEQILELFNKYSPDVFHIDCEGCEKVLLEMGNEDLKKVPEYEIEVHYDWDMLFSFIRKFLNMRYEIFLFAIDPEKGGWALTTRKIPEKNFENIPNKGYRI